MPVTIQRTKNVCKISNYRPISREESEYLMREKQFLFYHIGTGNEQEFPVL